jgi:hypothetical protein
MLQPRIEYLRRDHIILATNHMGEHSFDENNSLGVLSENISEQKAVSFKDNPFLAYENWLKRNLGEEAAQRTSEKIVKLMLKAESKWNISVMRILLSSNSERGDEYFDKMREVVTGTVQLLPRYSVFQTQSESKQTEVQRWLLGTYVGGLLSSVRGKKNQFDASLKGIAWSLLAKDGRAILEERGQTIDSEWLFKTMGPLIRSNADPKAIGEELTRFTKGDPSVIHSHSAVP